ncbi:MAG: alpha-L-fucosidase [Reichenbachiella sp.]
MKKIALSLCSVITLLGAFSINAQSYDADWKSLAKHNEAPEWFQDAKLGIYFHWGIYSVPAHSSEWYPYGMHREDNGVYKHHLETYGHPSDFGYHNFVPFFKAEYFDADEWAELFLQSGAKFAGPVAEHHDGFSMWESEITPFNAVDKGPKRDITGELAKAIKARDMKFITTFHHARNLQRFDSLPDEKGRKYWDSHFAYDKGMPTSSEDPELKYMYGNIPAEQWHEEVWFGKLKEVVDKYQPDIVWFDSWLDQIPEEYRKKFSAYYLNEAEKWDKEVVIVRKQNDLPLDMSVDDLEKTRKNRLEKKSWMTDETLSKGSWCYTENLEIKDKDDVLHVLIDIVSKNGVLLLNISPKANGVIPEDQRNVLKYMGEWLAANGEAIYKTRPWYAYGEGPTVEPEGTWDNHKKFAKIKYSYKDIRYTTNGNNIYAMPLGKPVGDQIIMSSFNKKSMPKGTVVTSVSLLGSDQKLEWKQSKSELTIEISGVEFEDTVPVFKIVRK